MFRRLWAKIKAIWKLAKEERASPRELFWAVFLGAFAGSTPAVGIHGWVAVGLATLFKKNRLWAWIGSRISNMVFLPFITIAEVQVAHFVRTGEFVSIDRHRALSQARELILDWCLGTIPVGTILGLFCGALAYVWQKRRLARRAAKASRESTPETEEEIAASSRALAEAAHSRGALALAIESSRALGAPGDAVPAGDASPPSSRSSEGKRA